MKQKLQLLTVLAFFITSMHAQKYSFEETPGWVKPIDIPAKNSVTKYDIMSGYYLTLEDYQVNLEENSFYNHEVTSVLSYGGITNASQLSITYDTSYQELKVHHLHVWRKGKKIDRTDSLSLEIMNNEYNLQQGIYTGRITAYDILNDIRKDDLIDFAYSIVGKNPIFDNEKYLFIPLEAMNPIDLYHVRVLYPAGKGYKYLCEGCDSLVSVSDVGAYTQIEIRNENVKAVKIDDYIPSWEIAYKYFTLSSFKSWKDVNTWAQKVFKLDAEPNLDVVFDEIFDGSETTGEQVNKIINYVQDDIRYMGVETGIGSIKPFSPEQVVKKRFGDCKDKSLLLVWLLKKVGVGHSYPVLVNTMMQHELAKQNPSNEIFNHCIVMFEYGGETYWVDPTIAMQGGDFKDLNIHDYGKALIIGKPSDSLQTMSAKETGSCTEIIDEFTIHSFTEPAKLTITSNRYGFDADQRRSFLEYYTTGKLVDQTIEELKALFPVVDKSAEIIIADDQEHNKLTAAYNFSIDGFWQDGDKDANEAVRNFWYFKFEPLTLYQYLNSSTCTERESDYALNYPLNLEYHVIFHFPQDLLINDDFDIYDNAAFYYDEKIEQLSSNSFEVSYNFWTKTNCLKPSDFKDVCDEKNTIHKCLPIVIYFPK